MALPTKGLVSALEVLVRASGWSICGRGELFGRTLHLGAWLVAQFPAPLSGLETYSKLGPAVRVRLSS